MKATGIVRQVDELGRIVLPIEIRKKMGINQKDPLEIYVDDDSIILKNTSRAAFSAIMRARMISSFSTGNAFAKTAYTNCSAEMKGAAAARPLVAI